jgi:hypothetical protein
MPTTMTYLSKANGFVTRALGEETIVVPVRSGVANLETIFTMNSVGTAIWQAIDGTATVDALVRVVATQFDITESEAAPDVAAFVELLTAKGLVLTAEHAG